MKKHVDTLAIASIGTFPGFITGGMLGAIMLTLNYPLFAAAGMAASLFLLPFVTSALASCRQACAELRHRSDNRQIAQRALSYFSFGFLFFGALQVKLSVLPCLTQPIGTLLLPSSVLFCIVQALFMGFAGARKVLLDATKTSAAQID
jgi:hypothetical protein